LGLNLSLTRKGPGAQQVQRRVNTLEAIEVLVGIPQARTNRPGEPINNASLMYIHTHGSPARRIPARPVIEPAIVANRTVIDAQLHDGAKVILEDGGLAQARAYFARAGQEGANAAIRWFTDPRNNWAPNAPSTIRAKGSDRPLIDTGSLRRAITWVVRNVTP
jgi:hypothetical protein